MFGEAEGSLSEISERRKNKTVAQEIIDMVMDPQKPHIIVYADRPSGSVYLKLARLAAKTHFIS